MGMTSTQRHEVDNALAVGNWTEVAGFVVGIAAVVAAVAAFFTGGGLVLAGAVLIGGAASGCALVALAAVTKTVATIAEQVAEARR